MTTRLFGGTVRSALLHALTDYDRKQEASAAKRKAYFNHYALAHYCRALERFDEDIAGGMTVRAALLSNFNGRLLDVCLKAVNEPKHTTEERIEQNYSHR